MAGGTTDVINGQALCPTCNLKKGTAMETDGAVTTGLALRDWQRDALVAYHAANKVDFLCVATPGAGKTVFVLALALRLLSERRCERMVVVVPTNHLRGQWAKWAAKVGVNLDPKFTNRDGWAAPDYDGMVVTYQQVAASPLLFRHLSDQRWMVVFDELHHAGKMRSWGTALEEAFALSGRRLAITGTPFRSDSNKIPFVHYGIDGKSTADYTYGYEQAMREGVCRPIYFPTYGGDVRWWTARDGEVSASFRDDLADDQAAQRLRAALSTDTGWLPEVLREADARLRDIRAESYPDAGGLVVAMDQTHALAIAAILEKATGESPFVAISDMPDASEVIDRFGTGDPDATGDPYRRIPRWLVAVKMVSEGVDIPRLCVGVYATNVVTELYFRQVVGRFVRSQGDGMAGWLYVPRDPALVAYMQRITEEVAHVIAEGDGQEEVVDDWDDRERRQRRMGLFTALGAEAEADDLIFDQETYSQEEIRMARAFKRAEGFESIPDEMMARLLRKTRNFANYVDRGVVETVPVPDGLRSSPTLQQQKKDERAVINKLVNRLCGTTGLPFKDVHYALEVRTGSNTSRATLDQLRERRELVKGWLELADVGGPEGGIPAWIGVMRDAR